VASKQHIADLSAVCAGLPDRRKGPLPRGAYTMADIGLSAFSLFFMGSPSFLAHQRTLAERARIILLAATGLGVEETARHLAQDRRSLAAAVAGGGCLGRRGSAVE
jgi:hypothetical protein